MCAAGATALLAETKQKAREKRWTKVSWCAIPFTAVASVLIRRALDRFKLRLRPKSIPSEVDDSQLPPLPAKKTVEDVLADFIAYLMDCAETFIKESHRREKREWTELRKEMMFVIAHPNGWEGVQQTKIRRAAVDAGLIPNTPSGKARVVFVSEGEASLHYCIRGGFIEPVRLGLSNLPSCTNYYKKRDGFIVADLGGGTLDFSAYRVVGTKPLRVEEVDAAKCTSESLP